MVSRCVGIVVSGEVVTVVDTEIPDDDDAPVTIVSDDTWSLQKGDKGSAYAVLHQRCANFLRENKIRSVVIKASAVPTGGSAKLALLTSAEVRGVVIAAAASVSEVKMIATGVISRTYGKRKVAEYVKDDTFWSEHTIGGKLRKTSREAAMLIIATRSN
jgi:hypothetical protein